MSSVSASNNFVDTDCLKGICKTESKPEYLDSENIRRAIYGGEQEVMRYPADSNHMIHLKCFSDQAQLE
jgi:hypothetical protein